MNDNLATNAFSTLSNEVKASLHGLITQTADNIKANPTTHTVAAQGALLLLSAPALLPTFETDGIVSLATLLQEVADKYLAPAQAPTPAPAPQAA